MAGEQRMQRISSPVLVPDQPGGKDQNGHQGEQRPVAQGRELTGPAVPRRLYADRTKNNSSLAPDSSQTLSTDNSGNHALAATIQTEIDPVPLTLGLTDQSGPSFRPDLQGLRAVAILLVWGIHLTGVRYLPPRPVHSGAFQARRMPVVYRRCGRHGLGLSRHNEVLIAHWLMGCSKLQDPIEQHPAPT